MILFFCVFSLSIPVRAEKIIITATPIDDSSSGSVVEKSPTAFSEVIKIDRSSYGLIDLNEALKMASSVDLPDYGGSVTAPISLRGSNFQQTLIMVDGMPISPVTGDMVDLSLYTIPEIHQVEIIKGSNSASYGKSAMGGAVNLVTKNPTFDNSGSFTSSQGSYGYSLYNALINTCYNEVGFLLNLTRSSAENDFLYEREDGSTQRRLNNDSEHTSVNGKIQFDAGGWNTLISATIIEQRKGSPGSEGDAGVLTPTDETDVSQNSFILDTSKSITKNQSVIVKASRLHNRTHNLTFFAGDAWTSQTTENLDLAYLYAGRLFMLSPGVVYTREKINSDDYGIHSRNTASGYLSSSASIKPCVLSLTLRYDNSSDFDGAWTYHSGIVWNVLDYLDLKANIGSGYREPSMGHLYTPSTWYTFIRNPELKPEKSVNWDIGPSVEFEDFGMGVSYFKSSYRDLIKMDFPAASSFTYINVDKATATGIEAYAWVKPLETFRLSANYSFNQFRYASGEYESKTLKHKPKQVFNLQADFNPEIMSRKTNIFLAYQFRQGVYTNESNTEKTGNRNIFNTGISVEVIKNAIMSLKVNNVFNDTSVEYKDSSQWGSFWYPVPGRTYRFSIQLSL